MPLPHNLCLFYTPLKKAIAKQNLPLRYSLQNHYNKMAKVVKPYHEDDSKKEQVSRMFDRIAPRYDFLNRLLSLGIDKVWRKRLIAQLDPAAHQRILDVATGTADVAIALADRYAQAQITGIDISKEMLAIGQQKIEQKKLTEKIDLQWGDSEKLPFSDNSYDAVTVAFGVRNFEHLAQGLREMHRVLRPGGRLVVLEFSRPTLFPFKQLYNFYFRHILPGIGRLTSKDNRAYTYLYESVQSFPDGQDFVDQLANTAFKAQQCIPLTLGICTIYVADKPA